MSDLANLIDDGINSLKNAIYNAKERIDINGQLLAVSAGIVLLSLVLMAVFAPIAAKTSGFLQFVFTAFPFLLLVFGIGLAIFIFIKYAKNQEIEAEAPFKGTIAQYAIEVALSEVEEAGLIEKNNRDYDDCLTGKIGSTPIAIIKSHNFTYCVLRIRQSMPCFLMMSPDGKDWPFEVPENKNLTGVMIGGGINARAWTHNTENSRKEVQILLRRMKTALKTALAGGEIPFIYGKGRSFVLAWHTNDIGPCSLISCEFVKVFDEY